MEFGYWVGWLAVALGICVAPFQLYRILKTKTTAGISIATYSFLCAALLGYLLHAVWLRSEVFITAQSVNLTVNGAILYLLIKGRKQ